MDDLVGVVHRDRLQRLSLGANGLASGTGLLDTAAVHELRGTAETGDL